MNYSVNKFEELREIYNTKKQKISFESITCISLLEFETMNIAVEIYSDVLNSKVWICSNDDIVSRITMEYPKSTCFSVEEVRQILILNPTKHDLEIMNDLKSIFNCCKIKSCIRREAKNDE